MHLSTCYIFLEICCIHLMLQFPASQTKIIVFILGIIVTEFNSFCPKYFYSVSMEVTLNVWSHSFLRIFHVRHQMLVLNRNVCDLLKPLMKWRILHSLINITFRCKYSLCVTDCSLLSFPESSSSSKFDHLNSKLFSMAFIYTRLYFRA